VRGPSAEETPRSPFSIIDRRKATCRPPRCDLEVRRRPRGSREAGLCPRLPAQRILDHGRAARSIPRFMEGVFTGHWPPASPSPIGSLTKPCRRGGVHWSGTSQPVILLKPRLRLTLRLWGGRSLGTVRRIAARGPGSRRVGVYPDPETPHDRDSRCPQSSPRRNAPNSLNRPADELCLRAARLL
jgi:hypothetical protein